MLLASAQSIAVCFGTYGPYTHARVRALQTAAKFARVVPVQIAAETSTYEWKNDGIEQCDGLRTLCGGTLERGSPLRAFLRARKFFIDERIDTAFLASYWPAAQLAVFAAAKSRKVATVMMSDSHAGTEGARGWKKKLKIWIVNRFDAALVAGAPQREFYVSLGLPGNRVFTGFDAVDNSFFAAKSELARRMDQPDPQSASSSIRATYGLPARYFLSLGRMVEKKNLSTLLDAYELYVRLSEKKGQTPASLVFVGSGEKEPSLRAQARALGLSVVDRAGNLPSAVLHAESPDPTQQSDAPEPATGGAAVYFFGFRQIDVTPMFYALAEGFVLPSSREEWGLVVNEAMACATPVIVSRSAGCAEDLLPIGGPAPDCEGDGQLATLDRRENGFAFDPTSVEALARALLLMQMQPDPGDMGRRSREIVERFSCENFAQQALRAAEACRQR